MSKPNNHDLQRPHFVIRHSSFVISRRGLTLIEMLIGMAITLVMMAAVVNLFANIGAGVRVRRAGMEMSGQLRMARARLFKDLAGATCDGIPKSTPGDDDKADGYIEIVEGQFSDKNPTGLALDFATSLVPSSNAVLPSGNVTDGGGLGDYDDILALTVRSESEPFVGRGASGTIQSNLAEVVWYAVENPADGSLGEPGMRTVYRRVLLIAPWVGPITWANAPNTFFQNFDISARYDTSINMWVPNTLADLVKRENRFAHSDVFPHAILQTAIFPNAATPAFPTGSLSPLHPFGLPFEWDPADPDPSNPTMPPTPDRQGEDVMLNDVLAFDVRVFDPGAQLVNLNNSGIIVEPSDAGWRYEPSITFPVVGVGAFVDLNYWGQYSDYITNIVGFTNSGLDDPIPSTHPNATSFSGSPSAKSQLALGSSVTYDTWSFHYENDGLDQDDRVGNDNIDDNDPNTGAVDEGTNGLDDDNSNGVDDIDERETLPPYNVPLRGIQVKLRIYERDSRQIREATVTRSFVP